MVQKVLNVLKGSFFKGVKDFFIKGSKGILVKGLKKIHNKASSRYNK